MIITKLEQKYAVGSGKGISAVSEPNLGLMLNTIVDWDRSRKTSSGEPSLIRVPIEECWIEPGDTFSLGVNPEKARMVLALDTEDRLVCIINDTGIGALERVLKEQIEPEFGLMRDPINTVDVRQWTPRTTATDWESLGELTEVPIDKCRYRLWKNKFLPGRPFKFPEGFLELTVVSDESLGMEIPVYLTKYSAWVPTDNMFLEIPGYMPDLVQRVITWMYQEVPEIS